MSVLIVVLEVSGPMTVRSKLGGCRDMPRRVRTIIKYTGVSKNIGGSDNINLTVASDSIVKFFQLVKSCFLAKLE